MKDFQEFEELWKQGLATQVSNSVQEKMAAHSELLLSGDLEVGGSYAAMAATHAAFEALAAYHEWLSRQEN